MRNGLTAELIQQSFTHNERECWISPKTARRTPQTRQRQDLLCWYVQRGSRKRFGRVEILRYVDAYEKNDASEQRLDRVPFKEKLGIHGQRKQVRLKMTEQKAVLMSA